MADPRVGFVTGLSSWWRLNGLRLKYYRMRAERVVYPDVYCLTTFLTNRFRFLRDGERVRVADYDMLIGELNADDSQLAYLEQLVTRELPPLALVPGAPEVLTSRVDGTRLERVVTIARRARWCLAFSPDVKPFYDRLIGEDRAIVIPWPFDFQQVGRLAGHGGTRVDGRLRIVLDVPMRFVGVTQNDPVRLGEALRRVWETQPVDVRARMTFHTFVYTSEDRACFEAANVFRGLPITIEPRMSYQAFIRFLSSVDAVVNLTASSLLGRVTFLSAALMKPGLFSDNSFLNRALYPTSCIPLSDAEEVGRSVEELLDGLVQGRVADRFRPDIVEAERAGAFGENARRFRELLGLPSFG